MALVCGPVRYRNYPGAILKKSSKISFMSNKMASRLHLVKSKSDDFRKDGCEWPWLSTRDLWLKAAQIHKEGQIVHLHLHV